MAGGLKKQWALGEPTSAGSDGAQEEWKKDFKRQMALLNSHLLVAKTIAAAAPFGKIANKQSKVELSYSKALKKLKKSSPKKSEKIIDLLLDAAKTSTKEGKDLVTDTERAKQAWEGRAKDLDTVGQQINELDISDDEAAPKLLLQSQKIHNCVAARDWDKAQQNCDALVAEVGVVYADHLVRAHARKDYEARVAALDLSEASVSRYPELTDLQADIIAAQGEMEKTAKSGDYKQALLLVGSFEIMLASYRLKLQQVEQQEASFEARRAMVERLVTKALEAVTPAVKTERDALINAKSVMDKAAQGRRYGAALKQSDEVGFKITELDAAVQAQAAALPKFTKQRPELDQALEAAAKREELTEAMKAIIAQVENQVGAIDAHAQKGDHVAALEQLMLLARPLLELKTLMASEDQKPEIYSNGLAALEPRLEAAFRHNFASLKDMLDPIEVSQKEMVQAAKAQNYDAALGIMGELDGMLFYLFESIGELEAKKFGYEEHKRSLEPLLSRLAGLTLSSLIGLTSPELEAERKAVETELAAADGLAAEDKFEHARGLLDQVAVMLTSLEASVQTFEKSMQDQAEYIRRLPVVQTNVALANKDDDLSVKTMQGDMAKIEKEMSAAATAGDYGTALEHMTALEGAIDKIFEATHSRLSIDKDDLNVKIQEWANDSIGHCRDEFDEAGQSFVNFIKLRKGAPDSAGYLLDMVSVIVTMVGVFFPASAIGFTLAKVAISVTKLSVAAGLSNKPSPEEVAVRFHQNMINAAGDLSDKFTSFGEKLSKSDPRVWDNIASLLNDGSESKAQKALWQRAGLPVPGTNYSRKLFKDMTREYLTWEHKWKREQGMESLLLHDDGGTGAGLRQYKKLAEENHDPKWNAEREAELDKATEAAVDDIMGKEEDKAAEAALDEFLEKEVGKKD